MVMKMTSQVKEIEVTFAQKRPAGRFSTDLISVSLRVAVDVATYEELKKEIHEAFARAREYVKTEQWVTEKFGTTAERSK